MVRVYWTNDPFHDINLNKVINVVSFDKAITLLIIFSSSSRCDVMKSVFLDLM